MATPNQGKARGKVPGVKNTAPRGIAKGEQIGESGLPPVAEGDEVAPTHVQVRALANGFRRAGRAWSTEAETVSIDEFSDEQLEQLVAEPMLSVTFVVADAEPQAD